MMSDGTGRAPRDTHRVSLNDELEVRYWTMRIDASKEALAEAINAVGNRVSEVEAHLRKQKRRAPVRLGGPQAPQDKRKAGQADGKTA